MDSQALMGGGMLCVERGACVFEQEGYFLPLWGFLGN